jgi:hypothetical protein
MTLETISLDDTDGGHIYSEAVGATPDQVTFVAPSHSTANFGGGFFVTFIGGVFRHSNKELVEILTRLSKKGTGIVRLTSAAAVVQAKAQDPIESVKGEVQKEAETTAAVVQTAAGAKPGPR